MSDLALLPLKMTAAEVLARLERHYIQPGAPLPGGVFVPEVTLGRAGGPRADALYVGFTSTRGRLLYGHEIKVSRSDWLHELDQPDKADPWASQCHAWYVVAPSTDVVRPEELPHGWGLLTCDGGTKTRCRVAVKAMVHQDRQPSWTAVLSLLARADTLRAQAIGKARQDADRKAHEGFAAAVEREVDRRLAHTPDVQALQKKVQAFEDALGVRVKDRAWREDEATLAELAEIGRLLRAHHGVGLAAENMFGRYGGRQLAETRRQLEELDRALEELRDVLPVRDEETS